MKATRWSAALSGALLLCACGDDQAQKPPSKPQQGVNAMLHPESRGKAAAAPAPAAPAAATPAAVDIRKKNLKDEDFVESASNRDPFHSFIGELSSGQVRPQADYYVYFDKYACEELKLIAVVTGGLDPRALFRDPTGLGIPLKVGDHLCRARWKIKRIVAEGVVVETEEDTGGVKPKLIERMLPINPGEEVNK